MRGPFDAIPPGVLWTGFWILALFAALLAGAMALHKARKDLLGEDEGSDPGEVGEALREAYDAGELTEEEYRKVRASLDDPETEGLPPKVPRF